MAALFNVILRKATYHFRRGVPADLRAQLRRRELVRSLATSDPRTAKLRACRLYVASENLFSALRTTPMLTEAQLARMVQDFYSLLLNTENWPAAIRVDTNLALQLAVQSMMISRNGRPVLFAALGPSGTRDLLMPAALAK